MRVEPDRLSVARLRLRAMATGRLIADHATPRRTAARRTALPDAAATRLLAVPADALETAATPQRMGPLIALAAAIEIAEDIAAIIDRSGRATLDAGLGEGIRRMAVEARALSGPRQWLSPEGILAGFDTERRLTRAFWSATFPAGLVLGDGHPAEPLPLVEIARRERLVAALEHAAETVQQTSAAKGLAA